LSPIIAIAATEIPVGGAEPKSAPSKDFDLPAPSGQSIPLQTIDSQPASPPPTKVNGFQQIAGGFVVPAKQNLAELVGRSEISVLADVDGQVAKIMAEIQIFEEELARQVDETDFLESIRAGRNFNRESLAALARTEQSKAQTGQAFALLLPSVSVRVSYGEETSEPAVVVDEITGELLPSDTHSRTDTTLTVRQPLFNLPIFLDWRRRKVKEQARVEDYRISDGDAYLSTVNAYLSLVSSRLQTDITRDFKTQLAELLNYIEKRAEAGAASISDMSRVRARSQETRSSLLEQESTHAAAGIEFVRLTNLAPQKVRLPMLDDVGASLLPETFEMAVATAIESNPEITALTAELQAAQINKSAAKGRYLPRVDAEYTDTYALHAGGDTSSSGQRDRRLMMVLNWDLFSGGGDYKYHVELTARHKELQYRLDDQRRQVVQALSANYAGLATTRERITSGYQELESISVAAAAMSKRMLSGNQSLLDLLTVYDRYYQVRSRLVSLHILEMNTVAQLVRSTFGAPWAASEDTPPAVEENQVTPLFNDPFWDQGVWDEGA
jgi:adhesin transport system outer membrane protein